jgi:hypothetical protein
VICRGNAPWLTFRRFLELFPALSPFAAEVAFWGVLGLGPLDLLLPSGPFSTLLDVILRDAAPLECSRTVVCVSFIKEYGCTRLRADAGSGFGAIKRSTACERTTLDSQVDTRGIVEEQWKLGGSTRPKNIGVRLRSGHG